MKKSFNNMLVIIGSICIIGILSILFILVGPNIKDRFTKLSDFEHQYLLEPGIYEIGTHIPAGTYYVRSDVEETCKFDVYDISNNFLFTTGCYQVRNKTQLMQPAKQQWGIEIKNRKRNIELGEGKLLMIYPNTQLFFYSNRIEDSALNTKNNSNLKTYQISDVQSSKRLVSGKDFESGVYDILYEPKNATQEGRVSCVLKFVGSYESKFTMTFDCSGSDGDQVLYKNIPFTKDSVIVTIVEGVSLVPSKVISAKLNEITSDNNN